MYRWLVGRGVRLGYTQLVAGRPQLLLALVAPDVEFHFPGVSSFGATLRGREALRGWMARFVSMHPRFTVQDVVVTGPPWRTRVAVRFDDAIGADYRNEGVEYLTMRWGRVTSARVFLDTEVVTAWEAQHPELIPA